MSCTVARDVTVAQVGLLVQGRQHDGGRAVAAGGHRVTRHPEAAPVSADAEALRHDGRHVVLWGPVEHDVNNLQI